MAAGPASASRTSGAEQPMHIAARIAARKACRRSCVSETAAGGEAGIAPIEGAITAAGGGDIAELDRCNYCEKEQNGPASDRS
ncbi:hypothetical protein GCM10017643_04850 [Ancylobacter dichloromethanicus]|uniref:Uncharacterized protein n=1 Tax=Ancylobacter dichloromethanicus TaxID=518825 RepID=A0A9W6J6Y5_9HYPH|nr:hypothetical protein GCM10017643_04850 [Ancylobacter dichloromethanicus]